jgi:hypothetical protein
MMMKAKQTNKPFLEILAETVESVGPVIFSFQSVSVGFFKSLSEFHQNLILKLLCSKSTSLESILAISPDHEAKLDEIEAIFINKYKMFQKVNSADGKIHYKLEKLFGESIKSFIAKGLNTIFHVNQSSIIKCLKEPLRFEDKLKTRAFSKWNNMHKFMLKRTSNLTNVQDLPSNVVGALEDASLIMSRDRNNSTCFDFLLDNIKSQVSIFLYAYCKHLFKIKYKYLRGDKSNKEAVSEGNILNLIFHLTLLFPTGSYMVKKSAEALEELHLTYELVHDVMTDLDSVGLLRVKEEDGNIEFFATTPLIHNIFNSNAILERGFKNEIIVECDFKIYAYSNNSEYMEALLNHFTEIKFKMPTFVVCSIEEEKVREAYNSGIQPSQILRYLNSNTHKEVMKAKMHLMSEEEIQNIDKTYAFIPENIVQQMIIWNI